MKRKRSPGGLSTAPKTLEERQKRISVNAEHHLNALRKGYGRTFNLSLITSNNSLLQWSSLGTIVFAPPLSDTLSVSNAPGDIYGPGARLYATTPSLDVTTKHSVLLDSVAQVIHHENTPIDHILFNEMGNFLAVVDQLGSITIWEQDNIATQLVLRQSFNADDGTEDSSHESASRIVSLRWLHNDQKVHVALKLSKPGDQWNCQSSSQRGYGPYNTVGKEALLAITSDGRVEPV